MKSKFVVDISVGSRFHAFDLARELDHYDAMRTLYTGYPACSAHRFSLRSGMICSVFSHEVLNRFLSRIYRAGLITRRFDAELSSRFDRIVAGRLRPGANIFVGWSSQCRETLQRAKAFGMRTIVERGSTHILWQAGILEEEAKLSGLSTEIPSEATIASELAEYASADFIAVPSSFAAETFVRQGVARSRLLVNPYGVDLNRFQALPRSEPTVGRIRVLHVGRCSPQKGVHYLLKAVRQVAGASVRFVGALDPGIGKVLESNVSDIYGAVPSSELPKLYADADVFCLLSVQEGLALVIAQAMACGLPIIATRNTGAADLITDGVEGFLVPIRNSAAVAAKLALLRDAPQLRKRMGALARERVRQGFAWSDYGVRAMNLYRERVLSNTDK